MKTKIVISIIAISMLTIIVVILINNKAKSNKATQSLEYTFFPVKVDQVKKEKLNENLSFTGTIVASKDVTVVSEAQGKVVEVFVEVGNFVQAGSPIVRVDDEVKKANYTLAEANYNKAKKDLERYKKLFESNTSSDQQLEAAQVAFNNAETQYVVMKRQYNDTKIVAPFSGVITSRMVEIGNWLNVGVPVANIADISSLKVKLSLSEGDAFKMKKGDIVSVSTEVYPDFDYKGKINWISDKSDEMHIYPTEIIIENNKKYPLKSGMFGRVTFASKNSSESLVIPREALVGSTKDPKVFVVNNNIANLRNIEVGITVDTKIQVLSGLAEGETFVVVGHNNLKDGFRVTIVHD